MFYMIGTDGCVKEQKAGTRETQ